MEMFESPNKLGFTMNIHSNFMEIWPLVFNMIANNQSFG